MFQLTKVQKIIALIGSMAILILAAVYIYVSAVAEQKGHEVDKLKADLMLQTMEFNRKTRP